MYTATGSRITIAIGVLAVSLAAISPTVTWAAEPVKQEKKAKKRKSRPRHAQARPPQKRLLQNSPRQRLQEKLHPVSVKHRQLDKLTPDEGKAGDKVTITGTRLR